MFIKSGMPSNHLILYCLLLLLPSIFSRTRVFSSEPALHIRWPEYWTVSFNISPYNKYSGLISFRIDWFDLLAVQGILKSLLQHHNSKASGFWCSAFFMVQLSHPYMTTGKTTGLMLWNFVGKTMSLLFRKWQQQKVAWLTLVQLRQWLLLLLTHWAHTMLQALWQRFAYFIATIWRWYYYPYMIGRWSRKGQLKWLRTHSEWISQLEFKSRPEWLPSQPSLLPRRSNLLSGWTVQWLERSYCL